MYRTNKDFSTIHVNFLTDSGGVGDLIATLPAWNYIYKYHPQVIMHVWVPDYSIDLVKRSLPVDKHRLIIKPFSENHKYNENFYARATGIGAHTNLATHPTRHAFNMYVNVEVPIEEMNYLSVNTEDVEINQFQLPEKYVVIATGFTSEVREFLPKYVNEVARYVVSRGYTPVFLGKKESFTGYKYTIKGTFKEEIDFSLGLNLVDKTTLVECQKIIANSKCIVGLDCGLIHLAATSEVPIIVSYTTVKPEHRLPYRHGELGWNCYAIQPPESLGCRGCQSNWSFGYETNFTKCHYVEKKIDTKIQCIEQITSNMYIKELEKVL